MLPPRQLAMWPQRFPDSAPTPDATEAQRLLYERVTATLQTLERERVERGWTWATVARIAGISDRALRNLRAGRSWPDLPTFVLIEEWLARDTAGPASQVVVQLPAEIAAEIGSDVPADPQEVEKALIEVAADEVLPPESAREYVACVLCELVRRYGDHGVCPDHGGSAQKVTFWEMIEGEWVNKRESGKPGAQHGLQRMIGLQGLARSYAQNRDHAGRPCGPNGPKRPGRGG